MAISGITISTRMAPETSQVSRHPSSRIISSFNGGSRKPPAPMPSIVTPIARPRNLSNQLVTRVCAGRTVLLATAKPATIMIAYSIQRLISEA
jgi:hypothetical protein